MFKRTKFYLLLLAIVTSTAVGLFNFPRAAYADTYSLSTADAGGESPSLLVYQDDNRTPSNICGSTNAEDNALLRVTDKDQMTLFGLNPETQTAYSCVSGEGKTQVYKVIYYDTSQDGKAPATGTYQEYDYLYSKVGKETRSITFFNIGKEAADAANESKDIEDPKPSPCPIDGIGWLICPVVTFIAKVTDQAYDLLEGKLLRVEPLALPGITSSTTCSAQESAADPGGGDNIDNTCQRLQLYESWKMMRNIANVVFIILFLIIILSQTTSIGISNYGIKRLLPKLIVAAILVNLSYYICAIAIDIANILGNTLRDALMSLRTGPKEMVFHYQYTIEGEAVDAATGKQPIHTVTSDPGWEGLGSLITVGVAGVVVAGIIYIFLPVFLPIIFAAMLSVITVVLTLTMRQALIILLIIVSPLAFVALLLPNTEGYFHKWRTLFVAMLMVYPIISVIFGASALAADILMKSPDFTTQMIGAGVSVIPLFITPIVMKVSGGLLNRWVGLVNDPNRGPIDSMRKGIDRKSKKIDDGRKIEAYRGGGNRFGGFRYRRGAKKDAVNASLDRLAKQGEIKHVASEIEKDTGFQAAMAGELRTPKVTIPQVGNITIPGAVPLVGGKNIGGGTYGGRSIIEAGPGAMDAVKASAVAARRRESAENVKNMEELLKDLHPNDLTGIGGKLQSAVRSGNTAQALAAQNILFGAGDGGMEAYKDSMKALTAMGVAMDKTNATMTAMRDSITEDHAGMKDIANDVAEFGRNQSGSTLEQHTKDPRTWNKMTARQAASQKATTLENAILTGGISPDIARQIVDTPTLAEGIRGDNLTKLKTIAGP